MLPAVVIQVAYQGTGSNRTVYSSVSPNPGGAPDHNHAVDTETQAWDLRYPRSVTLPVCGTGDCGGGATIMGATGRVRLRGTVDHVHKDGLYAFDDASQRCTITYAPRVDQEAQATVRVSYTRTQVRFEALSPIENALVLMPTACPGTTDGIDGLSNNYFTPGYSLLAAYNPARWFTSGSVSVSRRTLTAGRRLKLRFGLTSAGRSPKNCDRGGPSYATCSTSGLWSADLTVTVSRPKTTPADDS